MHVASERPPPAPARRYRDDPESVSLILSSYNQPRALELTLRALAAQTRQADEIVIADDGSMPATFETIDRLRTLPGLPPIRVHTQPDDGFRKTEALNAAVLMSHGQQLLFLDGDVVPPPSWIERHCESYRPMGYTVGEYARVGDADSRHLFDLRRDTEARSAELARLTECQRSRLFWRGMKAHFYITCRQRNRPRLLGGNFSVDRGLLFGVNGFEERFAGTGGEDSNLRYRFNNYRGRPRSVIMRAVGVHVSRGLEYPEFGRNRTSYLDSDLRFEKTARRAVRGLAERMTRLAGARADVPIDARHRALSDRFDRGPVGRGMAAGPSPDHAPG